MKKYLVLSSMLAGCFQTRSAELTCEVTADCDDDRVCDRGFCLAATDAGEPDAEAADAATFDCTPLTTRWFTGCDLPAPGEAITVTSGVSTYNTDTGQLQGAAVPSTDIAGNHVLSVDSLTIASGATLRVIGSKPLIIASWSTVEIAGTIDVSSKDGDLGAGANPGDCSTHAATVGQNNDDGSGGGGGGSMAAVGGRGGNGDRGVDGSAGGVGGTAIPPPLLLGGCAGAAGGDGPQAGGKGGAGGGAIGIAALTSISVTGTLHAGGAGGRGSVGNNGGGGGGGAGGMIVLESALVSAAGTLAVNGGAGGSGSTNNNNSAGAPGQDAQITATRAIGGVGGGGGNGGLGGAGATLVGTQGGDDSTDAGGGGGGSAGFVVVASTNPTLAGTISPAATVVAR